LAGADVAVRVCRWAGVATFPVVVWAGVDVDVAGVGVWTSVVAGAGDGVARYRSGWRRCYCPHGHLGSWLVILKRWHWDG
jgi:hypothetical protein